MKMVFSDSIEWMVRFPPVGKVCDTHANKKVTMKVTALNLIHSKTTIPIPKAQAWGPATSNPLGLSPSSSWTL
jgi:hypothetical protein